MKTETEPFCSNDKCKYHDCTVPKHTRALCVSPETPHARPNSVTVERHRWTLPTGEEMAFCDTCVRALNMVYGPYTGVGQ